MGPAAQPMECYLATRGLKTLKVRMEACQANAQKLAEELEKHPKIEKVFYPGLPSHKNYEVQKKQARGGGAMIAMRIKGWVDIFILYILYILYKLRPLVT